MITFKQLHYALAIEKTLHFKKAAERCNISQSALSTALNELEKQLGVRIFERDNKKVLVTPAGREVLNKARSILLEVEELKHLADHRRTPLSYPMTVGSIPTIAPFLIPKMLPVLHKTHPQASINIIEDQSHVLVDLVRRGEIDTAILALPFECDGLLTLEFWQEDFYWVAPRGDDHTNQQEITSDELHECRLLLLQEGHCLKSHILEVCKFSDLTANQGFGATSLYTLIQMVLGGLGTTLIPAMARESLIAQHDTLATVHLNEPGPHRRLAFILRPGFTRTPEIEALIRVCRSALTGDARL